VSIKFLHCLLVLIGSVAAQHCVALRKLFNTADNAVSTVGTIYYVTGRICDKEASTAVGAVAKNYVLMLPLEGGAVLCLDNK
jgi:hypothetical protein